MTSERVLFLCTTGYPYGIIEDFLHKEVLIYSDKFEQITLFVPEDVTDLPLRILPENVSVITYSTQKSLGNLFYIHFWYLLFKDLGFSFLNVNKFKVAFAFYNRALNIDYSIRRALRRMNPSQHVVGYSYWYDEGALALSFSRKKGLIRKVVCRAHGWDIYKERHSQCYLPYREEIAKQIDGIYCVSNFGLEYIRHTYSVPSDKLHKAYLGTLPVSNTYQPIDNKELKIISVSNVIPLKRVGKIAEVLQGINCPFHWTHVGNGLQLQEIEKYCNHHFKESGKFDFVGEVSNEKVIEMYEQGKFDVFISLSTSEGLPVSMMEALSMGVPIVSTNVGGVSEIVIPTKTGWLLESDNPVPEARKILENLFFMEPSQKQSLKAQCIAHWDEHFNAVKNYRNFFQMLLSEDV